jgi:mannose-6-phosphate isomerase-like protein (cupin superfamily)
MNSPSISPALKGHILGADENSFVIAEWQEEAALPGPPRWIAPLHVHHNDDEAWYVLEGKLCVKSGDEIIEAGPGAAVMVGRGKPHTYWNPDPSPVRYLLIMTPTIHRLIQAIHATPDRSPDAMRTLFQKFESELL